ncbi:hypothetical protein ACFUMH_04300 [Cellulomonas sp. NPDC057328]|uniref:hypothetical protein n=1 Tax=Cellulomonas sp. NPDC057328 TaxID=3346101 RepID=UPI00364552BC
MTTGAGGEVWAAIDGQDWQRTGRLSLQGVGRRLEHAAPPADLSAVRALDLSGNRLSTVPSWLSALTRLEALDLAGNRLDRVDVDLPHGLHTLNLSENRLRSVPEVVGRLRELRWLDLGHNSLEHLEHLAWLRALQVLILTRNRLHSLDGLPASDLRRLNAAGNGLRRLWSGDRRLTALRFVDLAWNDLTTEALAPLAHSPLSRLHLDGNRLRELPPWLPTRVLDVLTVTGDHGELKSRADVLGGVVTGDAVLRELKSLSRSTSEPGERNFDAPERRFEFTLAMTTQESVTEVVNLYYTGHRGVDATLTLSDRTTIAMDRLTPHATLDLVHRHQAPGAPASLRLGPVPVTRDGPSLALATEALARVPSITLMPSPGLAPPVDVRRVPPERVVDVMVARRPPDGTEAVVTLGRGETLVPSTAYVLQVSIGPRRDGTIVVNAASLRVELLEPSSEGWWFDVVVSSADVALDADAACAGRLFVPFDGPGWVCPCAPERPHECRPEDRRPAHEVPFQTHVGTGVSELRCTVYHRGSVVQSLHVVLPVGVPDGEHLGLHAEVDYALAEDLARAAELPQRRVAVLTNDSGSGTHTIVVKGVGQPAVQTHISESGAAQLLQALRQKLTLITLGEDGRKSQYDTDNAAGPGHFRQALQGLARLGSQLWTAAVRTHGDREALRGALRGSSVIQVSRVTSSVFPWSAVYDIARTLDGAWVPCGLLDELGLLNEHPDRCPYETTHEMNTLCPFGFWGIRHQIEEPASVLSGTLPTVIPMPAGPRLATVRSLNLETGLSAQHLEDLQSALGGTFSLLDCDSRDDLLDALRAPLPLVYFYSHGRVGVVEDTSLTVPYLELGQHERFSPGDLDAWAQGERWQPQTWRDVPPLIFLNGCNTAELTPERLVSFVEDFAGMYASGVIGTEISVHQHVAGEIARRFLSYLIQPGATVGGSLRKARLDMLAKGNLAGLAYTAFCSADLELVPA